MDENKSKEPLEVLHRLSRAISRAAHLDEIFQIILDEAANAVGVERASIMKFDAKKGRLRVVAAKGLSPDVWKSIEVPVGEGISGQVFQSGEPMLLKDFSGKRGTKYRTQSLMTAPVTCFPMKVGKIPLGVINMTDKTDHAPFTEQDLKLLTSIADQVGAYMHLNELIEQLQEAEKARQQLEIARGIQKRLLPGKAPEVSGVDVAGLLISAERVGADYYDYILSDDQKRFGVAVADVSGHDVGGALLASSFRTALRTEAMEHKKTSAVVSAINKTLYEDLLSAEQFISMFYCVYQRSTKTLKYTNAGHNPPLLLQKGGTKLTRLLTHDLLLGIESDYRFHDKKVSFKKGDVLILYTDGLTEAMHDGERFGIERLESCLEAVSGMPAQAILDKIMQRFRDFIGLTPPRDDVTVVVLSCLE